MRYGAQPVSNGQEKAQFHESLSVPMGAEMY